MKEHSKVSIELVPKSKEFLQGEMRQIAERGIQFDGYNLPELVARPERKLTYLTPEEMMQDYARGDIARNKELTLHLRMQDRSVEENVRRIQHAAAHGVTRALLVTGDTFSPGTNPYPCVHDVLNAWQPSPLPSPLKGRGSSIDIAVGADLYQPFWGRWSAKVDAIKGGKVNAVFTQPIFHERVLDDVRRELTQLFHPGKIYAGVTWVTGKKGREFWQEVNNVPAKDLPSGRTDDSIRRRSIEQAKDMLDAVRAEGYSAYLMVMRGTVEELAHILS